METKDKNQIEIISTETIEKPIKAYGNGGAHITVPRRFLGQQARVEIYIPKPFICEGCSEIITQEENFSDKKNQCINCFETEAAIKKNECLNCKGPNPKKEFWGVCEYCSKKEVEDNLD